MEELSSKLNPPHPPSCPRSPFCEWIFFKNQDFHSIIKSIHFLGSHLIVIASIKPGLTWVFRLGEAYFRRRIISWKTSSTARQAYERQPKGRQNAAHVARKAQTSAKREDATVLILRNFVGYCPAAGLPGQETSLALRKGMWRRRFAPSPSAEWAGLAFPVSPPVTPPGELAVK